MSGPIYDFLELVQTSLSDLITDYIYKRPGFSEAVAEEKLEFLPCNESNSDALNLPLMLLPII